MADENETLVETVRIQAPPAAVWALVSDVTRHGEWSPQVVSSRWKEPATGAQVGARFTNKNSQGGLDWPTHAEVVACEAEQRFAFRVEENWAVWSFTLTAEDDGSTTLTQRRETPEGVSDLSRELIDGFMGGWEAFTAASRDGMATTLAGIKQAAEA